MKICKHCGTPYKTRSGKGLCRKCWDDADIHCQYTEVAPFGGPEANSLSSHEVIDREWIETLLQTSAALKIKELGGKYKVSIFDMMQFFGHIKAENICAWNLRMRRVEMRDLTDEQQRKINYLKSVASILEEEAKHPYNHVH